MAQYYHILDYKGLPVSTQAALVSGLPYYARVKAKIRGDSGFSTEETLLAVIADKLAMLVWLNSEDGRNNTNRPRSILAALSGGDRENEVLSFDTPEEFEAQRERILSGEGEER